MTCNAPLTKFPGGEQTVLTPGEPSRSGLSIFMHATDAWRMPPLATKMVDTDAVGLVDDWIRSLTECP
jgi:hypothetical protein